MNGAVPLPASSSKGHVSISLTFEWSTPIAWPYIPSLSPEEKNKPETYGEWKHSSGKQKPQLQDEEAQSFSTEFGLLQSLGQPEGQRAGDLSLQLCSQSF